MSLQTDSKICTHCGKTKPLSNFRPYYNGRKGYYRYCRTCEKLLMRYKYLFGKGDTLSPEERKELTNLERLYEYRRAEGLETPGHRCHEHGTTATIVDQLLAEFENKNNA